MILRVLLAFLLMVPAAYAAEPVVHEKSAAQKESDKELYDRTSEIEYPPGSTAKAYLSKGAWISRPLYYMFHTKDVGSGDVNGDGVATCFDYGLVMAALETAPGHLNWDSRADMLPDKKIDEQDVKIVTDEIAFFGGCDGEAQ